MHDSFSTTWIRVDTGPICRPFVLAQEKGFGSGLAACVGLSGYEPKLTTLWTLELWRLEGHPQLGLR